VSINDWESFIIFTVKTVNGEEVGHCEYHVCIEEGDFDDLAVIAIAKRKTNWFTEIFKSVSGGLKKSLKLAKTV
jgi:hypothetical protein